MFKNLFNQLESISINIAYDKLDEPNLYNLDFQPNWLLEIKSDTKRYIKWSQVDNYFPNLLNTFNKNTLEYFYNSNSNFIYPVLLYSTEFFYKYDTIDFDVKLIESIKQNRAKIVFFYATEAHWGVEEFHFEWMERLSSKYGLSKEQLIFVTANLKVCENYKRDIFTIIPYNFFLINLDFIPLNKSNKHDIQQYENNYLKYIENNKINKKNNHILCFNGIARLNRLLAFATLQTNKKLQNTSVTSLRKTESLNVDDFYNQVLGNTSDIDILNFYKNYNSLKDFVYDKSVWGHTITWGATLNESAHMNSFVNLVTETLWDDKSVFITEKTYKPIYMCQPFIIFGNPHSLKIIKQYGFKTFDKWWDESYDDELDLNIRLEKITNVLEEIASWDMDKCNQITIEMEDIFIHNFNKLLSIEEMINLYTALQTNTKNVRKSIV